MSWCSLLVRVMTGMAAIVASRATIVKDILYYSYAYQLGINKYFFNTKCFIQILLFSLTFIRMFITAGMTDTLT